MWFLISIWGFTLELNLNIKITLMEAFLFSIYSLVFNNLSLISHMNLPFILKFNKHLNYIRFTKSTKK